MQLVIHYRKLPYPKSGNPVSTPAARQFSRGRGLSQPCFLEPPPLFFSRNAISDLRWYAGKACTLLLSGTDSHYSKLLVFSIVVMSLMRNRPGQLKIQPILWHSFPCIVDGCIEMWVITIMNKWAAILIDSCPLSRDGHCCVPWLD